MSNDKPLCLGIIGCGAFGRFCLEAFGEMDDVRIAAVADISKDAAENTAKKFGAVAYCNPRELIACDDVHIVHVATPPASHHELALAAIRAGKHVLCEKPLAMNLKQADEILSAAERAGVIVPVNFVLRYNPVTDAVKAIIASGVLGKVLAGRLTNCAFDSLLPPEHWFWDKGVSGGIFVEHGVHFFDLYRYWLGSGRVINAHAETREGTSQEDRLTCTVKHTDGALVSHYHGFDQIQPMDRTDHRLICEMGDIRVEGWVPISLSVDAAVDAEGTEQLAGCCGECNIETTELYDVGRRNVLGRGKLRRVTKRVWLRYAAYLDKQAAYADGIRALLADQVAYIRDRSHARRVTEADGRDALILAETAAKLAAKS